jgi:hypothetical protein
MYLEGMSEALALSLTEKKKRITSWRTNRVVEGHGQKYAYTR